MSLLIGEAFGVAFGVRLTRGTGEDVGVALIVLLDCFGGGAGAMGTCDVGLMPGLPQMRLAFQY